MGLGDCTVVKQEDLMEMSKFLSALKEESRAEYLKWHNLWCLLREVAEKSRPFEVAASKLYDLAEKAQNCANEEQEHFEIASTAIDIINGLQAYAGVAKGMMGLNEEEYERTYGQKEFTIDLKDRYGIGK